MKFFVQRYGLLKRNSLPNRNSIYLGNYFELNNLLFVHLHMQKKTIHRAQSGLFSAISNDLVYHQEKFQALISQSFNKEAFAKQIETKTTHFQQNDRVVLVQALHVKYQSLGLTNESIVLNQIARLKEANTFTVTTGHQLNLFTGTLYFVYKILHVIQLAKSLKESYPDFHFVPVYWMASEDHDFQEINHTRLFNKEIRWENDFGGAVGRYPLENWSEIQAELKQFFANHPDSEIHHLIDSYNGENLSEATFRLVHALFAKEGLVIVEPDCFELKQQMVPIFKQEIQSQMAEKKVFDANKELEQLGFQPQVFPRPINLFHLSDGKRTRMIPEENGISVEGIGTYSVNEWIQKLEQNPKDFSPNVVLRPVYQERVLPNLAYVGGGGEMAYWLQLKGVFDLYSIPYPLIQVRNSLQLIDPTTSKKMEKIQLQVEDLFTDLQAMKKEFVIQESGDSLDFTELHQASLQLEKAISEKVSLVDSNLHGFAQAEITKLNKQMEQLQEKLIKHQKNQFQAILKHFDDVQNRMFPQGGVQERKENFFSFCGSGEVFSMLELLKEAINPWENDLIVLNLE